MIRLIAVDLDGTLLDHRKQISAENVRAIAAAQAQGVLVTVCSGRSLTEAAAFAERAGCADRMICEGGTMIADRSTLHILQNWTMPPESAYAALDCSVAHGLAVMYYANGQIVTTASARDRLFAGDNGYIGRPEALVIVPDLAAHARNSHAPICKLLACGEESMLANVRASLVSLPGITLTSSGEDNFEVLPAGTDKGTALLHLCEQLGLTTDECAAIGDNENDLSMLNAAGFAVAMGNAPAAVQACADFVTADNSSDGAAKAIWHILSQNEG